MAETVTINGMQFEKTKLVPNYRGEYDTNPCEECHLNLSWVDYGSETPCLTVNCNRREVYTIIGGMDNLKRKL